MKRIFAVMLLTLVALRCFGVEVPVPGEFDSRVRYIVYRQNEVTLINVKRGVLTRIILAEDERIVDSGSGFPTDCGKEVYEWCIHAVRGDNQIWVKPKEGATTNNFEMRSNKRDYSFEFHVLDDKEKTKGSTQVVDPMYRVVFRYPLDLSSFSSFGAADVEPSAPNDKGTIDKLLSQGPVIKNGHYSMQILSGGTDIAPNMVFDDGFFTYFQFPPGHELPSIYYVTPGSEEKVVTAPRNGGTYKRYSTPGEEVRVNFHVNEQGLVVVERMGRQFNLRLGQAVVGVWNDAFDANGQPMKDGVTVDGLIRAIKTH
jgi:type IV secretion system protein VirB9